MGNAVGFGEQVNGHVRQIGVQEGWLQNQTFRIKGKFYTLSNRRGGGEFGSVWSSTMPDGRHAAVKVFDLRRIKNIPGPDLIKSFEKEVKMSYRMRDAKYHVVNIYGFDFDKERRVALMAMELGDDTLEDRIKHLHISHRRHNAFQMIDGDYISSIDRKSIWIQLVQILIVLHQHNIVHRDMKPANLVFFGPILKIVDLGIAQKSVVEHYAPKLGGTHYYSAPECFNGNHHITSKADIWSSGAILYHLSYGVAPKSWNSYPPFGYPPTRSTLVQEILNYTLQDNPNNRPSHRWLSQHSLTSTSAIS